MTTDAGIAIDSAAALSPANTPVCSGGTSDASSGQPEALLGPVDDRGLADPRDGDRERADEEGRDQDVRPRGDAPTARGDGDEHQERDLARELDPGRDALEDAALADAGDVGEERDVRVGRDVEEDREQDDRDGQPEDVALGGGEDEERRRQRDPERDERPAPAEPRAGAVGERADGGLDDRALDAAGAREQAGEEIAGAGGAEQLGEHEVVECVERARADGAGRVAKGPRPGQRLAHRGQRTDTNIGINRTLVLAWCGPLLSGTEEGTMEILAAAIAGAAIAAAIVAAVLARRPPSDAPFSLLQQGMQADSALLQQTLAELRGANAQALGELRAEMQRSLGQTEQQLLTQSGSTQRTLSDLGVKLASLGEQSARIGELAKDVGSLHDLFPAPKLPGPVRH